MVNIILDMAGELPIAYCPVNDVEAWSFPFFIKKGRWVEPDQLLLKFHLWHMTGEEKAVMGELVRISGIADLEELGYPKDDRGVFIIHED
jgi:hypothetical protein